MRKVIRIDEPKSEEKKPVEFTDCLTTSAGWEKTYIKPSDEDTDEVVYLGECGSDGDMFAVYYGDSIVIFKGHLNSGEY